jgi:hypothetical protein
MSAMTTGCWAQLLPTKQEGLLLMMLHATQRSSSFTTTAFDQGLLVEIGL